MHSSITARSHLLIVPQLLLGITDNLQPPRYPSGNRIDELQDGRKGIRIAVKDMLHIAVRVGEIG